MEDFHYIEDNFNGNPKLAFFAVYDGHGGKEAASFASLNLHKVLQEELLKCQDYADLSLFNDAEKTLEIISKTYSLTDEKIKTSNVPSHHGCTAVTCLVTGSLQDNNRYLFVANAGDSRAVLCRDGKGLRLTLDHKTSNQEESKRITDLGGFIIKERVNGQIMITRSLGDHLMKEYIIGTPYVHFEKLTEKDTVLILACDGLWDVVSDQGAADLVLDSANCSLSSTELSKRLLVKALDEGSTDNLTVMVVKL